MRTLLLLITLLACLPSPAQVYKWTDSTGKTIYGDKPPDDVKKAELPIQSYDGPVEVRDWSHALKRKDAPASAPASSRVTMYSTSWCGYCKKARAYFAARNVSYSDVDIEKSPEGNKRYKELGGRGVPLIVVGTKVMRGFSPEGFEALRK